MRIVEKEVKTKDSGPWTGNLFLVDSTAEAVEVYGEDGATYLINAGLSVKQQNIEREIFSSAAEGADPKAVRADAEQKARDYRPGGGAKVSNKTRAFDLIKANVGALNTNKDLDNSVREALIKNNFKEIITLLTGEKVADENEDLD